MSMKAVILHGTSADHTQNWFPWLKNQLENLGQEVWVPDLPGADLPQIPRYNEFLLGSKWDFNNNLIVGHSSGAVEALALLEALPDDVHVKTVVLVGVFRGDLGWESLHGMNKDIDMQKVKKKADRFIVVHSDDDPYCPMDGAKWVADQLNASMKIFHGMGHFSYSLDSRFKVFPELLEIIKTEAL